MSILAWCRCSSSLLALASSEVLLTIRGFTEVVTIYCTVCFIYTLWYLQEWRY